MSLFIMVILSVLILIVGSLVIWGIYAMIDHHWLAPDYTKGLVKEKKYHPPGSTITTVHSSVSGTCGPIEVYHCAVCELLVETGFGDYWVRVKPGLYRFVHLKSPVEVEYVATRLSKKIIIRAVRGVA